MKIYLPGGCGDRLRELLQERQKLLRGERKFNEEVDLNSVNAQIAAWLQAGLDVREVVR